MPDCIDDADHLSIYSFDNEDIKDRMKIEEDDEEVEEEEYGKEEETR
jgi:hypothetical protein